MSNPNIHALIKANPTASAADILGLAQADVRTANPLPLVELTAYGVQIGLTGRLAATAAHPNCPAELKVGLAALFEVRQDLRFENIHSEQTNFGAMVAAVLNGLVAFHLEIEPAVTPPTMGLLQNEADKIISLAGGYILGPVVTLEQVQAELDAITRQTTGNAGRERIGRMFAAISALWTEYLAGTRGAPTDDEMVTALRAA